MVQAVVRPYVPCTGCHFPVHNPFLRSGRYQNRESGSVAQGFAAVFAALCIIALLSAGMYLFAARSKKSLLCALFSGYRLLRYISVLNWEVGALEVVIVFNMLFARFIWQGDGHNVSDRVFDAGVRPIQFALVCALLAALQRKVWNIIGEKTGQLKKSPYD